MPNLTTNVHYQQVLSMALEDRPTGYQDLVSNNNALLRVLDRKGAWETYSGPRIRETLQIAKQTAQWYSGYDQLLNPAIDLVQCRILGSQADGGPGDSEHAGDLE